jgi:hypothetical protein
MIRLPTDPDRCLVACAICLGIPHPGRWCPDKPAGQPRLTWLEGSK